MNRSRTWAVEAAFPPGLAAAAAAALDALELMPVRREHLRQAGWELKRSLSELGLDCGDSRTPIVSIRMERLSAAEQLAAGLFERGFLVEVLGGSLLRNEAAFVRLLMRHVHLKRRAGLQQAIAELLSLRD